MADTENNDRQLAEACLTGSEGAWSELVRSTAPFLGTSAAGWFSRHGVPFQRGDVEEVVQEVYVELLRSDSEALRRFGPPYRLRPYLLTICRRAAAHWLRRRLRPDGISEVPVDGETLNGFAAADTPETDTGEEVRRLLASLPPSHREVLRLRVVEGLNSRETAERLGIPVSTVTTILSRARKSLADKLLRRS